MVDYDNFCRFLASELYHSKEEVEIFGGIKCFMRTSYLLVVLQ